MENEIDILRRQVKDLKSEILSLKQKQHSSEQGGLSHIACEQAALDLQEDMKFRESFIQSLPGFFVAINRKGKTVLINDLMLQALGYTRDEVVGMDYLATLVPESEREKVSRVFQELLHKNETTTSENHIVAKDGKELLMEWQGRYVLHETGQVDCFYGVGTNITERKRAAAALSESEANFRLLVETGPEAIFIQTKGYFTYLNSTALKLFHADSAAELIGRPLTDRIHPDYHDAVRERSRILNEENQFVPTMEQIYLRMDGSIVPVEVSAVQFKYQGENGALVFARDITTRKEAEAALRDSEEMHRRIVEALSDAILLRSEGVVIYANPSALKLFRANHPRDLIGKRYLDLVHPADRALSAERIGKTIEENWITSSREHRILALDGQVVHVESIGGIVKHQGELQMFGVFRDITERKQAEENLKETEKKYRELAESLPQAIFEVDSNGNLIYLNHTGHKLFGYTPDDFAKGFNVLEAFIPEDRGRVAFDIKLNVQGQKLGRQDYTALRKDGTKFPAGVHAGRVMNGQTATGIRGILIDLTETLRFEEEKNRLESQLRQAQKMEAIGSLAGGIAHDFNNILSVIVGNAELLSMTDVSSDAKNGLDQILNASQRAKQLVRQILAFSRQGEQQKLLISLKPVVRETLDFLRASIPSTIQLQHSIKPDAGTIVADSTQMQQVLMNLCTNAAHAMENDGGVLKIDLDTITITEEDVYLEPEIEQGEYVKLTVSDTGHGIEPSVLDRIFDPYFTTKGPDKGTGLGLAVVHGITKSHGGVIKVYSEVGKGTVFHVLFPRADEAVKKEKKLAQPLLAGTERILLVDDEKPLADIYQRMLNRLGYQVETRTSPIEALEAVRTNPQKYDLIITDMTMPQMTGFNLAKRLMDIRPDLPVILCTGFSDQMTEEKARSVGILAFILKPVLLNDMADTLRKVLDEKQRRKPH